MIKNIEVVKNSFQRCTARAHSLVNLCDPRSRSQNAKPHEAHHQLLAIGEELIHFASQLRASRCTNQSQHGACWSTLALSLFSSAFVTTRGKAKSDTAKGVSLVHRFCPASQ